MKKIVIPAIIAPTPEELYAMVRSLKGLTHIIQLDIMDGIFVQNRSIDFDFNLDMEEALFEAHCMVADPEQMIEKIWRQVETIIVHHEACSNPRKTLGLIKKKGRRAGIAINPGTPLDAVRGYLAYCDQVLVMAVEPGLYGSPFVPETSGKVKELRSAMPLLDIEVDGGINPDTIEIMNQSGANKFVSGSYIMKSDNIQQAIRLLQEKVDR